MYGCPANSYLSDDYPFKRMYGCPANSYLSDDYPFKRIYGCPANGYLSDSNLSNGNAGSRNHEGWIIFPKVSGPSKML